LQQGAPGRIHSGFLELGRQHLAQTLEAADLDGALTLELARQQFVLVAVVAGIGGLAALAQSVKRGNGEVEMAASDQIRHLAVKKSDEKRGDMSAVDVGIGHDDDLLVAQVGVAVMCPGSAAERLDQVSELLVGG